MDKVNLHQWEDMKLVWTKLFSIKLNGENIEGVFKLVKFNELRVEVAWIDLLEQIHEFSRENEPDIELPATSEWANFVLGTVPSLFELPEHRPVRLSESDQ